MRNGAATFGRLVISAAAVACTPGPSGTAADPPATVTIASPPTGAPPSSSPGAAATPAKPPSASVAEWVPGTSVRVRGRVSKEPWQHLMTSVPGKEAEYFDVEPRRQIVVYVAKPIACTGEVELEGVVLEAVGASKRPGKVDETYREIQLDVTSTRCLP